MDDKESIELLLEIREPILSSHVGFDSLPQQLVRKRLQEGFVFNILLVGETGIGKSTLFSSLFNISMDLTPSTHSSDEVTLNIQSYDLHENGVNLKLSVVETIGYGDQMNRINNIRPIVNYIESQFENYLKEELKFRRSLALYNDTQIHACLYFICPTGHGLKSIDLYCMKELHEKVNVIPIVAKSDSFSKNELQHFKTAISKELEEEKIKIYQFGTNEEEFTGTNRNTNTTIPFAVAASGDYVHIGDKAVRARIFPWGTMLVEDEEHSEFLNLKDMLIATNMEDMREKTHMDPYERYRRNRLSKLGCSEIADEPFNIYAFLEKKRNDLQWDMLEKEKNLKKPYVEKVQTVELELKEQESAMHLKYDKLFEKLELEKENIRYLQEQLQLEILSFQKWKTCFT